MFVKLNAIALLAPQIFAKFTPYADTLSHLKFSKNIPQGLEKAYDLDQPLVITSPGDDQQKYNCYSPKTSSDAESTKEEVAPVEYESPYHLLEHHFKSDSDCFLMADGYWMYELCFNKHVRQFHEDRVSNGKMNVKSYSMGKGPKYVTDGPLELPVPRTYHDKTTYPYFAVVYEGGDLCDLTKTPRKTTIQFTCDLDHTGNSAQAIQIMSMQESASCEYEFLVAAGAICAHPLYARETTSNDIICVAKDEGTPALPEEAAHLNAIALKGRRTIDYDHSIATLLKDEAKPATPPEGASLVVTKDATAQQDQKLPSSNYEKQYSSLEQLLRDFVLGESCLHGGSGWWRYEYCYGRYVKQFHEDRAGRTDIFLGYWDYDIHIKWAKDALKLGLKNSWYSTATSFKTITKPKLPTYHMEDTKKVMTASIFMTGGDVCDLTGQARSVHVRHICNHSVMKVNMILHEPGDCQYVLNVESKAFCKYLEEVDQYGMTLELETADSYLDLVKAKKVLKSESVVKQPKMKVPAVPKPAAADDPAPKLTVAMDSEFDDVLDKTLGEAFDKEFKFTNDAADGLKVKLIDGQEMTLDPEELDKLLVNPAEYAQKIAEALEKGRQAQISKIQEGAEEPIGESTEKGAPSHEKAKNYRKLPEITGEMTTDLADVIMGWNDLVDEILDYIQDDDTFKYETGIREGRISLMQVLASEDTEAIEQFYATRVRLINLGQVGFRAFDLEDLLFGIDDTSLVQIPEDDIDEEDYLEEEDDNELDDEEITDEDSEDQKDPHIKTEL